MATAEEKAYFARIAEQNRRFSDAPPKSLQEAFDRLDRMTVQLGSLAAAGRSSDRGDLDSHLAYLERLRSLDPNYRARIT